MRPVVCGTALLSASLMLGPGAFADTLAEIRERGSLRIGVSLFTPWTIESERGDLAGFEIEVGRRVAQAMGVDPEFEIYVWDEIIGGLERNEIDMIAAGMAITPYRAERVDFSDPYSEEGFTVVVDRDTVAAAVDSVRSLDRGEYVVAIVDATLSGQAGPLFFDSAEIRTFPGPEDAESAVLSGAAQVYLTSAPEAARLVARFPDRLAIPLTDPLAGAPAGFAVQRGNDTLLGFLNDWIDGADQQQWLEATYDFWFGGSD